VPIAATRKALNHPNILAICDIGTHDDAPFLVAELLEGKTLSERLRGGPLLYPVWSAIPALVPRNIFLRRPWRTFGQANSQRF